MNQIKIGRFIAECRKEENLTQMQLAEKLNITNKAVSKWEWGIAMPDASLMLDLCSILGISVNECMLHVKLLTCIVRFYHLLWTFSANPNASLSSITFPSSNTNVPVNKPNTWWGSIAINLKSNGVFLS